MKGATTKKLLKAIQHFFIFFLLVSFVITCCLTLFLTALSGSLSITFTDETLGVAAKLTMLNVLLLSLIFTILDAIRRKLTIERPVRHITDAAEKIMQGDLSARITPHSKWVTDEAFGKVITIFNEMTEELASVETLRTDFIANVSHEMKTPLAVMQNYVTLLLTPDLSDKQRQEYLDGIRDAARRMSDMMTNILRLNRLENQQIYPSSSTFDLGEQLCQCLLPFESKWEKDNIELETDIADLVTVKADEELLSLVWNNLFSNAFKFTPQGGRVSIFLTATERYATVRISDTGCGMSAEVGAHIFEKFYQGDTSHASEGNGLGLALVKRVVDILQGEIQVESALGRGTTFSVIIRRN